MSAHRPEGFGDSVALPLPWKAEPASASLVVCPVFSIAAEVAEIYRVAYEQARAAARPTIYERILAVCSN